MTAIDNQWRIVELGGPFRSTDDRWDVRCVDPNRWSLVYQPTGAVTPLRSTDLYAALDEAGELVEEVAGNSGPDGVSPC